MDFRRSIDGIDQPDLNCRQECPPEKGFALIDMSAWVMPMFIVPVSTRSDEYVWIRRMGRATDANREIITSGSTR